MNLEIVDGIINAVVNVPGVYGLAPIDFSTESKKLEDGELANSISLVEDVDSKKINLMIAIFVSSEMNSKNIVKEVSSKIDKHFVKLDEKLGKVTVYIRGVI